MAATFQLGVVILAAGASSRMGRPKLLLPWGGKSVLEHLIFQWHRLGAGQIGVVIAAKTSPMREELDRLGVRHSNRIVNPRPEDGMFSSIQSAGRWPDWNPTLTHWAIVLGDQPHLSLETLRRLVEFSASQGEKVCQPSFRGRAKHPVILPRIVFQEVAKSDAANLKRFLEKRGPKVSQLELDDPGLDLDLDTPADYVKVKRLYGERPCCTLPSQNSSFP
jgi:molybdenum cofactor cytidylyltransferase